MNRYCDLHTHSTFSDGTFTPTQIIDEAAELGLSAVALSDHNTIDGLGEFLSAAGKKNIEAIAGSEFSADLDGKELHLLGLFIPEKYFSQVSDLMAEFRVRKEKSNIELIEGLRRDGIAVDYDEIKRNASGYVNRAHIASALTAAGYTTSIKHAFDTLLSVSGGYYKAPSSVSVWEMIDFVRSIEALPVLAHPFLNLDREGLMRFLPKAKAQGLAGMECYYSKYDEKTTQISLEIAAELGLLMSGGSDFHGDNKPDIRLGVGRGNLRVPYEWAESLKNALKK